MPFIKAFEFIKEKFNLDQKSLPSIAIVLGSGLYEIADNIYKNPFGQRISYKEIPGFPKATVEGHKGELIYGHLDCGVKTFVLSGRLHRYEGYRADEIVFPLRVLKFLGIKTVILTNMSGALGDGFLPGDIMAITDHINFTADNPLIGSNNSALGNRFVDMSESYDRELIKLSKKAASENNIKMHQGVYVGVLGPCYETPSEIRMYKQMGGHCVGMSTIFETIAARHMDMKVLGLSCLSNLGAGLGTQKISHEEVFYMAQKMSNNLKIIIEYVAKSCSNTLT